MSLLHVYLGMKTLSSVGSLDTDLWVSTTGAFVNLSFSNLDQVRNVV